MILEMVAPGLIRKTCGAVSRTRLNSADFVQHDSLVGLGAPAKWSHQNLDPPTRFDLLAAPLVSARSTKRPAGAE